MGEVELVGDLLILVIESPDHEDNLEGVRYGEAALGKRVEYDSETDTELLRCLLGHLEDGAEGFDVDKEVYFGGCCKVLFDPCDHLEAKAHEGGRMTREYGVGWR